MSFSTSTAITSRIVVAATVLTVSLATAAGPLQFYSATPCRIVDTRNANGITGGPQMGALQVRNFPMRGYFGITSTAVAVSLNVSVVPPSARLP
jgi:hypothetical protein